MKTRLKSISIPKPCSEDWNAMTPMLDGKFCHGCEKIVVDFSAMSDGQIVQYFKTYKGRVCGQFKSGQVDRELQPSVISLPGALKKVAATAMISAAASGYALGQEKPESIQEPHRVELSSQKRADTPLSGSALIVHGIVTDKERKDALIGANIQIKGTNSSTITGTDGTFSLEIPESVGSSFTLVITYTGYMNQELQLTSEEIRHTTKPLRIKMTQGFVLLGDICPAIPRTGEVFVAKTQTTTAPAPTMDVSPTPFVQSFEIRTTAFLPGRYEIFLYDTEGRMIWSEIRKMHAGSETVHIDIPVSLMDGTYILHLRSKEIQLSKVLVRIGH